MGKNIEDLNQYLDIIEETMEVEKEAQKAYKKTEEETDNSKLENWVSSLKFDEIIHFTILKKLRNLLRKKRKIFLKMSKEFSYPDLSKEEAEKVHKSIKKHLQMERKQIDRYQDLQDIELDLAETDRKMEWLWEEEKQHHENLEKFSKWLEENYDL